MPTSLRSPARLLLLSAIACLLAAPLQAAEPRIQIETLGEPIRTNRISGEQGEFLVPKPGGGWWLLLSYHPIARDPMPCQVYVIDLDAGTAERRVFPEWPGALHQSARGSDGAYYFGHYATAGIWRFDPATTDLQFHPLTEVRDRIAPYRMQAGRDGRIYMGTASGKAYLIEFDPATQQFRHLGEPGPHHPAPRYIYTMAVDDDFVYCAYGKNPWYLTATNRTTGEHHTLLGGLALEYLDVGGGGERRAGARVTTLDAEGKKVLSYYALEQGQARRLEGPPELTPEQREAERAARLEARHARPELLMDQARPNSRGEATVWYRMPGSEDWRSVMLRGIETKPWSIHSIAATPDGRILGVPDAYEDVFVYDPAARGFEHLGKSPLSASDILFTGGKAYLLGYPGTYIVECDLGRPWTFHTSTPTQAEPPLAAAASNPRECHRYGATLETHYVRGSALGSDGMIYFGGHAERLHVGGALGWWDPATRTPGGLREPFQLQDCDGLAAAQEGRTIVYSSRPVDDPRGQSPTPPGAMLYLLDTQTKAITRTIAPAPGWRSCGRIVAQGDRVVGVGVDAEKQTHLYAVDLAGGSIRYDHPVSGSLSSNLAMGPDGKLYFVLGSALHRATPTSGDIDFLGEVGPGASLAFLGGDLYAAVGAKLLRVTLP